MFGSDEVVDRREPLSLGLRRFPLAFYPSRFGSGSFYNEGIGDELDMFSRPLRPLLLLDMGRDDLGNEGVAGRYFLRCFKVRQACSRRQ